MEISRALADNSNDVSHLSCWWWCGGSIVIIVSALSISLRDKERLRERGINREKERWRELDNISLLLTINSLEGNCFKFCRNTKKNPIQPVCGRFKSGAKKGTFKLFKNKCFLRCTTNAYKVKDEKCDDRVW